ncbi:MAG: hypothetical protein WCY54_06085, partial [Syntrophales bacterium]
SSMSYHRFLLIDQFIRRVNEWWLVGTKFTSDWAFGMWDLTNQYVLTGINGGILTLAIFIALISFCFQSVGRALHSSEGSYNDQIMIWAIGASLFSHVVAFIGISYFDQVAIAWYVLIAICAVIRNSSITGESEEDMERQVA